MLRFLFPEAIPEEAVARTQGTVSAERAEYIENERGNEAVRSRNRQLREGNCAGRENQHRIIGEAQQGNN